MKVAITKINHRGVIYQAGQELPKDLQESKFGVTEAEFAKIKKAKEAEEAKKAKEQE